MKRLIRLTIVAAILLCSTISASAQSTVYVFMRSVDNAECKLNINGGDGIDIRGPFKKAQMVPVAGASPLMRYHPGKKKIVLKEEGKTLFGVTYIYTNSLNGKQSTMAAEIQLNLSEGSVHYIKVEAKGLNDIQIKEVEGKEVQKLLKDKKYKELPDYIEQ